MQCIMDVQWRTRWHPVERKHDIMKEFRRTLKMDLPRPYRAREQQGQWPNVESRSIWAQEVTLCGCRGGHNQNNIAGRWLWQTLGAGIMHVFIGKAANNLWTSMIKTLQQKHIQSETFLLTHHFPSLEYGLWTSPVLFATGSYWDRCRKWHI